MKPLKLSFLKVLVFYTQTNTQTHTYALGRPTSQLSMCWGLDDIDPGHSVVIRDQCDTLTRAHTHTHKHIHRHTVLDGRYDPGWMTFCARGNYWVIIWKKAFVDSQLLIEPLGRDQEAYIGGVCSGRVF